MGHRQPRSTLTATLLPNTSPVRSSTLAAIDVASRNIANARVEGYPRKVQTTSTRVIDGQAGAVQVEEVTRNVNEQLQRDVREQSAVVEELKVIADFLSRFELQLDRKSTRLNSSH